MHFLSEKFLNLQKLDLAWFEQMWVNTVDGFMASAVFLEVIFFRTVDKSFIS